MDFGVTLGLWAKYNNAAWTKLHGLSPILTTAGDLDASGKDEAIAVFSPYGIYARYDNAGDWTRLHALVPTHIASADLDGSGKDDLIAVFSDYGVYVKRNDGAWTRLTTLVPEGIVTGDLDGTGKSELIADFALPMGLWGWYNDTAWQPIIKADAGVMATGDHRRRRQGRTHSLLPGFWRHLDQE